MDYGDASVNRSASLKMRKLEPAFNKMFERELCPFLRVSELVAKEQLAAY